MSRIRNPGQKMTKLIFVELVFYYSHHEVKKPKMNKLAMLALLRAARLVKRRTTSKEEGEPVRRGRPQRH